MGTDTLAFANFILILQVVSAVHSAFPDGSQLKQGNDVDKNRQGGDVVVQGEKPLSEGGVTMTPIYATLDDINEMQIAPPPTQKDVLAELSFEDKTTENAVLGTSKYYVSSDKNNLSGSGPIETNEIVKNPDAILKIESLSISNNNNDVKKGEMNKEDAPAVGQVYNYPNLDRAVRTAINNLPSSNESPLVPLIKVLDQRIRKRSGVNPDDLARDIFIKQHLILKLAKRAQKQKEENYIPTKGLNIQEPVAQDKEESDKTSQAGNINGANEDNEPCDCEGGCDEETPKDQTQPEIPECDVEMPQDQMQQENPGCDEETPQVQPQPETPGCDEETPQVQPQPETPGCDEETPQVQVNPVKDGFYENTLKDKTEIEKSSEQGYPSGGPDILAHVIVMLRRSKSEGENTLENPPLTPFSLSRNDQLFQPRESPPLADTLIKLVTKSALENVIPPSFFNKNEDDSSQGQLIAGVATGGCGDNGNQDESDRGNNISSFSKIAPNENEDESSEYRKRSSFTRFASDDQFSSFQNMKRLQNRQTLPKEFILLKALINIMKQKAAANALRESQETQTFPLPSFEELPNTPTQISRFVVARPINALPSPPMPSLHFPDETSGYKINHIDDSRIFPIFREPKQADSENEDEPRIRTRTLNKVQGDANNNVFVQRNSTPQELPWFIKNILANLSGQAGRGSLQPIPTPINPLKNIAEDKTPVFFRALLPPYSL